jgi:hypothetical protein
VIQMYSVINDHQFYCSPDSLYEFDEFKVKYNVALRK